MKSLSLFVAILTLAGCSTAQLMQPDTSRFPASTGAPYQVWVCRSGDKVTLAHYNALSTEALPEDQLEVVTSRMAYLTPDMLAGRSMASATSSCQCESLALQSGQTYYVDKSLFDALPVLDQSALQHDLALGGELSAADSRKTCGNSAL
jgi:hypothetical protein